MPIKAARKPNGKKGKESFSEKAYRELKSRILLNKMPVGRPFLEQELAELLNMSRTPTREAMIRLENEGLVEIRPRHGMFVKHISVDDMRDIYDVLTALESSAAALAAARAPSDRELAPIRKAVGTMEQALEEDDLTAWAQADGQFHMELVKLSKNRRLEELVQTFMDQSQRVRMLTLRMRPKPSASNRDHRMVLEAIESGDVDRARRTHREHRENASQMLVELLRSQGLEQL